MTLLNPGPVSVLAVGSGGGGGGGSACTEDLYTCTQWGDCAADGRQSRTCTLIFDCPTASTPAPHETATCTPPPAPPAPAPTPLPPVVPPPAPVVCREDRWECSEWSATCDIYGRQNRTCRKTFDCPAGTNPSPVTERLCERLQCGDLKALPDRVLCRLSLAPAGLAREYELQYLPEECRSIAEGGKQTACVARYRAFGPCWEKSLGEERLSCARSVLKLGPVLSEEVKTCQGKTGAEQVTCKSEVRQKVYDLIKFRMYDLEERAEELGSRGADLQAVAALVATIEEKKQSFNVASSQEERRQLILDVRAAWQKFINTVKGQVK